MQHWKPDAPDQFAGDMMPYWDGNRYHLFYLLDRNHHAEQGGLGGHQWAHAATSDLVHWEQFPLALPLGAPGSVDQNGICTGSLFKHEGLFHAFYATRVKAADGSVSEVICRAASRDLIHFEKSPRNPLFGAPSGYHPSAHRDPFVFQDAETGTFHLLVTAVRDDRGVLAHYLSADLEDWQLQEPLLAGADDHALECPEHFVWNGWWYLVYSHDGQMKYRTARHALGPWQSSEEKTVEPNTLAVPRTAAFSGGRRIAAAFLPWRRDERDDAEYVYAGSTVFREVLQDTDGTLFTSFVPEMMPATAPPTSRQITHPACIDGLPVNGLLSMRINPGAGEGEFGLLVRADAQMQAGYRLWVLPQTRQVQLQSWPETGGSSPTAIISGGEERGRALEIQIILNGSVVDVCINGRHCLVERGFTHQGTHLGFFAESDAHLEALTAAPLL